MTDILKDDRSRDLYLELMDTLDMRRVDAALALAGWANRIAELEQRVDDLEGTVNMLADRLLNLRRVNG